MNATKRFVDHVISTPFEALSPQAIRATKTFFLDTLGVSIAGTAAVFAPELQRTVATWGQGNEASVFGLNDKLPAGSAALINGFNTHSQEFDCVHEPAVVHPLASIQSGVLAWCQRQGNVNGKDLILALCLGVDVATTIGMAAKRGLHFFRPATAGVFGVTAAIGKLANLDQQQLLNAMGIALAQSANTMQAHIEGKPTLALSVGLAARAGLQSVDLAAAGITGPNDVLEGRFGYFPMIEQDWDLEPVLAELGTVWRMTQVSHKPFPAGRATHGGIDGIQQLKQAGLKAADVAKLELYAPPLIHQLVGRPLLAELPVNYARLCFQFVGAVALTEEIVDLPHFYPDRLKDKALHQLAERIAVIIDDNPDPNALSPQRLVVHLHDGSQQEIIINDTLGSPANPLSHTAHLDKFRRCWRNGLRELSTDNCEQVIEQTENLEQLENIDELLRRV